MVEGTATLHVLVMTIQHTSFTNNRFNMNHTIEQLRTTCKDIVARQGKAAVATACKVSRQAVGQAIKTHNNPFKYFALRLKIVELAGWNVTGGPFITLEKTKAES